MSRSGRPRRGAEPERGLDIFTLAGKSISGWLPFEKTGTGAGSRLALPYTTETERDALLYLANHPQVAYVQRGDIKPSFAAAHRLGCRLEVPFVIPYEFEGKSHDYYIDWVGVTAGAAMFGVEASIEEFKSDPQSRTKMAAAEAFFRKQGGWYGLFLPGETISDLRVSNLLRLNAHRMDFAGYDGLAALIQPMLLGTEPVSIRELVARLGDEHGARRAARRGGWLAAYRPCGRCGSPGRRPRSRASRPRHAPGVAAPRSADDPAPDVATWSP